MKYLFAATALIILSCGLALRATFPSSQSDVPVLYWTTGLTDVRYDQIDAFEKWLVEEQGMTGPDGGPPVDIRLDAGNDDVSKKLIQSVSGVAGDLIDMRGGDRVRYLQDTGALMDVTEAAKSMGFDPSATYPTITEEFVIDGKQYGFPCNVVTRLYWVNVEAFERLGMEVPPRRWTIEEFERIGKEFVERANAGDGPRRHFFANGVDTLQMLRTMGGAVFNETLTASTLHERAFVETLKLKRRWTEVDHILPSTAEKASFSGESGTNKDYQLFVAGNYGLFASNRWASVNLRQLGAGELSVSFPPYEVLENSVAGARVATIYKLTEHPELAKKFLQFLATEPYNRQIIKDGDALPPNPRYTELESFLRPPEHPNEWGTHGMFARAAKTIAIPRVYSPFILDSDVSRLFKEANDAVLAGRLTAEEAAQRASDRINARIEREVEKRPELQGRYAAQMEKQREIDALRAAGEPVPLKMIDNQVRRKLASQQRGEAEAAAARASGGEAILVEGVRN